ncbi:hypothetical protein QYF61_004113 [Mycteria americana]|uniref:Uncharacterized protein n=1 Tax=Mycteria americana TaxID=33587 RepID=A0AAN7RVE8_MYCAM|nr:hypothetical protein QYF61_004113 [Mycteria americana]
MGLNSNKRLNLSTVVMHGTEVYLENEWSWDSTNRLPQLLGKVGQEIKVGCRVINGSTYQRVTQISVTEVKTKKNQKKNCAVEKLDCWCNFTLVQPVFVVCLWAHDSVGLSFKFKITTMTRSFAAIKISKCHFLAWHAAQYAEVGNQVKLEIKYSQEGITDPMQIDGTTVTITAPNGRKWVVSVNCLRENKTLNRSELGTEASWYNQDYGRCPHLVINLQVWCRGNLSVEMSPELGGKWWIGGPEGFKKEFTIIAVLRPFVSKIGPYVVKQNHIQELLTGPVRSLKKVVLSLSTVNISSIRPHCTPFLSTLNTGWLAWLHSRSIQGTRARRDLLATALGGGGTGLGVLNSMNMEVLANKLEAVTSGVQGVLNPLNSSLASLGMGQWLVSEVLPTWEQISEKDHQVLLQALGIEQNNISLALSCIQAQMWVQSVVAGILRDGDNGVLPTEIRKIVWDAATEKERQLQAWWRLVNFTHDQVLNAVIAHVLTVAEARIEKVYPIVALGVNTNGSVVYPLDHRMWARVSDGKWQSVDLEACILERGLGFICEDDALKASDVCFDTKEGVCHFEINPQSSNKTMLVYVKITRFLSAEYSLKHKDFCLGLKVLAECGALHGCRTRQQHPLQLQRAAALCRAGTRCTGSCQFWDVPCSHVEVPQQVLTPCEQTQRVSISSEAKLVLLAVLSVERKDERQAVHRRTYPTPGEPPFAAVRQAVCRLCSTTPSPQAQRPADDEDSSASEGSRGFSADGFCKAGDMEVDDKSADSTAMEKLKQFHRAKQWLVHTHVRNGMVPLSNGAVASRDCKSLQVLIKVINTSSTSQGSEYTGTLSLVSYCCRQERLPGKKKTWKVPITSQPQP